MRRHDTESGQLSTAFWKAGADRYQRFLRGQEHENRGQFRLALRAYEGAGALKGVARMRARLAPGASPELPTRGSVTSFDAFWAKRMVRKHDPRAA